MKKILFSIGLLILTGCSSNVSDDLDDLYLEYIDAGYLVETLEASVEWELENGYFATPTGESVRARKVLPFKSWETVPEDIIKVEQEKFLKVAQSYFEDWDRSVRNTYIDEYERHPRIYSYLQGDKHCQISLDSVESLNEKDLNSSLGITITCIGEDQIEESYEELKSLYDSMYEDSDQKLPIRIHSVVDDKYYHVSKPYMQQILVREGDTFELVFEGNYDYPCDLMFINNIPRDFYNSECFYEEVEEVKFLDGEDHDEIEKLAVNDYYYSSYLDYISKTSN